MRTTTYPGLISAQATPDNAWSAATSAPRIYFLHTQAAGALAGWERHLDRIAGLGFSHVLISPPFLADDVNIVQDFNRPHPAIEADNDMLPALHNIALACALHGLTLLLDVIPDYVSADGDCARERPDLFRMPDPTRHLDPRSYEAEGHIATARYHEAPDALADWWTERLLAWRDTGVAGFRIASLRRIPPATLRSIAARLHDGAKGTILLGWTPGLTPDRLAEFSGCGLDFVFSSFPWWDFRNDWYWSEASRLQRVARVIVPVESPFGVRLANTITDPALRESACQRAARFAAAVGDGWMMPMGFESAAIDPLNPRRTTPADIADSGSAEMHEAIRAANAVRLPLATAEPITPPHADVVAVMRRSSLRRDSAMLVMANADLDQPNFADLRPLLRGFDGGSGSTRLNAGEVITTTVRELPPITIARPPRHHTAEQAAKNSRIAIENVQPAVDNGRFAAKRMVGEAVRVTADVICEGHQQLAAVLLWRCADEAAWQQVQMRPCGNDRWEAELSLSRVGSHVFTVEAWCDGYATYLDELVKKHVAGADIHLELIEGCGMVAAAAERLPALAGVVQRLREADAPEQVKLLTESEIARLMAEADTRPFSVRLSPLCQIDADRPLAQFASWYEIFPRSMSDDPHRHGTFADVIRHLPRIRDMGFDVLYFPPIHPIGYTNRKGRNNTLSPAPDDPGSPYAIGDETGGHDAIHAQLGTIDDFQRLREAAADMGLELALDFAIQCAPDHPWLKQHREWFDWRADGSLKYAENPPKKYEDIVNVDFYAPASVPDLWIALCEVVLFWAEQGIRIFRVDNPHTKPLPFWEWLIGEVRAAYPDAIFLAEAFTKPKMMYRLAKLGFAQSYTYFTWRNTAAEMREYINELTTTAAAGYFRPHFFVNTPDINPIFLQTSGRPGFLIRAVLAATLSSLWGIYCGFELCEATPMHGREEYLDSEKYQLRAWDWQRPGNIVADIAALNRIRRRNPALHSHLGVEFIPCGSDQVLAYERATPGRDNVLLVVVSFDPNNPQPTHLDIPIRHWSLPDTGALIADDLMTETTETWHGRQLACTLTPASPFRIWRLRSA